MRTPATMLQNVAYIRMGTPAPRFADAKRLARQGVRPILILGGRQLRLPLPVAQGADLAHCSTGHGGLVVQDRRVRAQALYPVRGRLADDGAHVNTRRVGLAHLGIGFRKLQARLVCCLLDAQRVMP